MRANVDLALAQPRVGSRILALMAIIAVALAAIGHFGVISFIAEMRRFESALRLAFGASNLEVLWLLTSSGLVIGLAGVALGVVGVAAASRVMSAFLFGIQADDLTAAAVATSLLLLTASVSAVLAARRGLPKQISSVLNTG
jgi:ABC-type antimicrobial peptide transport system permease subunit